jgi:hypothetical protein
VIAARVGDEIEQALAAGSAAAAQACRHYGAGRTLITTRSETLFEPGQPSTWWEAVGFRGRDRPAQAGYRPRYRALRRGRWPDR